MQRTGSRAPVDICLALNEIRDDILVSVFACPQQRCPQKVICGIHARTALYERVDNLAIAVHASSHEWSVVILFGEDLEGALEVFYIANQIKSIHIFRSRHTHDSLHVAGILPPVSVMLKKKRGDPPQLGGSGAESPSGFEKKGRSSFFPSKKSSKDKKVQIHFLL